MILNNLLKYTTIQFLLLSLAFAWQCDTVFSQDDSTLHFPIVNVIDPTLNQPQSFDLGDPSSVEQTIIYDPISGKYVFQETLGRSGVNFRNPSMMTLDEYLEYERKKALADNWKEKIDEQTEEGQPLEYPIKINSKVFKNFFGSDEITIRP